MRILTNSYLCLCVNALFSSAGGLADEPACTPLADIPYTFPRDILFERAIRTFAIEIYILVGHSFTRVTIFRELLSTDKLNVIF